MQGFPVFKNVINCLCPAGGMVDLSYCRVGLEENAIRQLSTIAMRLSKTNVFCAAIETVSEGGPREMGVYLDLIHIIFILVLVSRNSFYIILNLY